MSEVLVFGDVCPTIDTRGFFMSDGLQLLSEEIRGKIDSSSYVIGNLECALTDKPVPIKKAGPVLYVPTKTAASLKKMGVDAVSLANNHIRDCGDEGVESTIDACKKYGIYCFGAAGTEEGAKEEHFVDVEGKRIGFYAMAEREFNFVRKGRWGANVFDPYESFDDIRNLKQQVDYLVVLYHGGIEHCEYPSPLLQKKCRKMINSGADLVLCQHSHCIGSKEKYQHGEILYGQGNSIFGYRKGNDNWNYGLMVELIIDNKINVSYKLIEALPDGSVCLSDNDKPYVDFLSRSKKLDDAEFLRNEWLSFCNRKKALYMPMLFGLGTNMNRLNRVLHNKLVDWFYSRRQKNVTHNLIRCDAHREVVETLLSIDDYE